MRRDRGAEAGPPRFTKCRATEALQAILTDARRGELTLPDPVLGSKTYRDACTEWLRYVEVERGRSPSTVRDYRYTVNHRLLPAFGADTPVASITTAQIDVLRAELLAAGKPERRSIQKMLVLNYGILRRASPEPVPALR